MLGNLTTDGENIKVTADGSITIGLLNAGTGDVTVQSANGIILDGNGPSTLNVIAGSTTLSGNAPTARQLELDEEIAIAAAAAAGAEAAAEQTSADAFDGQIANHRRRGGNTNKQRWTTDEQAADAADNAYRRRNECLNGLNTAVAALQTVDLAVDLGVDIALAIAGPAQAIPIFGDGGASAIYAVLKIAEDSIRLALRPAQVAADAYAFTVTELGNADVAADATADRRHVHLGTGEGDAECLRGIDFDRRRPLPATRCSRARRPQVVSDQAIAARDQANVIGTPSAPLGMQVTGVINVTAGPTDSYLQVVGNTALDQINATGSVTLISTGAITNAARHRRAERPGHGSDDHRRRRHRHGGQSPRHARGHAQRHQHGAAATSTSATPPARRRRSTSRASRTRAAAMWSFPTRATRRPGRASP